jgi:drug/metabolite transporter (DMT)-like permease
VACWAWYALRNARWLRENPDKHPMMWATAQALVTLPVSLAGYLIACGWLHASRSTSRCPSARALLFVTLMLAIAVLCSWVGALCWNIASQKLPTVILGPLIVFETLAGLLYTFLLRPAAAAADAQRHPAAGCWRGLRGLSRPQKPCCGAGLRE